MTDRCSVGASAAVAVATWLLAAVVAAEGAMLPQAPGEGTAAAILQVDRIIRFELRLPVEPERAFDAWTDAIQFVEWLPHWAEMTVGEGETYSMGWEGYDGVWQGAYLEVNRPEALAFTWQPPQSVFPTASYPTTVRITFEELESGTLLVLEHSGFRDVPELEAHLQAWRPYLFALRAFLLRSPGSGSPDQRP